jgi:hypothetical protein
MVMIEFFRANQQDIMLFLSGICGIISFFSMMSQNMPRRRKGYVVYLSLSGMLLLLADRFAYMYRGDQSTLAFWMVRVCNFLVYFFTISIVHAFNLYLSNMLKTEGGLKDAPLRLRFVEIFISVGEVLLIISQFTGLYYTVDEFNRYQRAPGFLLSFLFPILSLVIQMTVIIHYYKYFGERVRVALLLFPIVPIIAAIAQIFLYGLALINIACTLMIVVVYTFSLMELYETANRANTLEIEYLKNERESMQTLFEQTARALVNAVDAKDKNTHGHSSRVAEYARKIAELNGKSEKECDEVYYAALLHDVGKIGISDEIILKNSELTDDEYEEIQQHVLIGDDILASITGFPYLRIGARYHHERYDGKGYPDNLRGDDIPEIARIIAVADAYDVMTSTRKYKDIVPQEKVREEIIKGTGTQFDPRFAKTMLYLIDMDSNYQMKERAEVKELSGKSGLNPEEYRSDISDGILITKKTTKIHMNCRPGDVQEGQITMPALLLFDSLDGHIYTNEKKIVLFNYHEYGDIWFDGKTVCSGARDMRTEVRNFDKEKLDLLKKEKGETEFVVEAVKYKDHALIRIVCRYRTVEVIVALPDSSGFLYLALTGEHCHITDVSIDQSEEEVGSTYIPRIAEEISYLDGPEGDVPSIQVDDYHSAITDGHAVTDGMKLKFHTMSLPTSRRVWHCPHIILFYSDDAKVDGGNYREFSLVRLDGEHWASNGSSENKMVTNLLDDFESWDDWKELNKKGYDCEVNFKRVGNKVTITTENGGIAIRNVTIVPDTQEEIYVALSGDQVALTNIRYE